MERGAGQVVSLIMCIGRVWTVTGTRNMRYDNASNKSNAFGFWLLNYTSVLGTVGMKGFDPQMTCLVLLISSLMDEMAIISL